MRQLSSAEDTRCFMSGEYDTAVTAAPRPTNVRSISGSMGKACRKPVVGLRLALEDDSPREPPAAQKKFWTRRDTIRNDATRDAMRRDATRSVLLLEAAEKNRRQPISAVLRSRCVRFCSSACVSRRTYKSKCSFTYTTQAAVPL